MQNYSGERPESIALKVPYQHRRHQAECSLNLETGLLELQLCYPAQRSNHEECQVESLIMSWTVIVFMEVINGGPLKAEWWSVTAH